MDDRPDKCYILYVNKFSKKNNNKKVRLPDYVARVRIDWPEVLLRTVYVAGALSMAMMAPNAVKILKNIGPDKRSHVYRAKRSIEKLIKLKLLKRVYEDDETYVELTEKGDRYLRNIYKIPVKQTWDGKWRVVIYDVPEGNRVSRNRFRRKLQEIGFRLLQTSVWIYPYKAEGLVDLIKTDARLAQEVIYMETDYIENDTQLKAIFGL